jgi:hypothetical protein
LEYEQKQIKKIEDKINDTIVKDELLLGCKSE